MSARYYVRIEVRDVNNDKLIGSGSCGLEDLEPESVKSACYIAGSCCWQSDEMVPRPTGRIMDEVVKDREWKAANDEQADGRLVRGGFDKLS